MRLDAVRKQKSQSSFESSSVADHLLTSNPGGFGPNGNSFAMKDQPPERMPNQLSVRAGFLFWQIC